MCGPRPTRQAREPLRRKAISAVVLSASESKKDLKSELRTLRHQGAIKKEGKLYSL